MKYHFKVYFRELAVEGYEIEASSLEEAKENVSASDPVFSNLLESDRVEIVRCAPDWQCYDEEEQRKEDMK